jgi:alkylation response protein AidB-like acyl-CoA dehydrogenase
MYDWSDEHQAIIAVVRRFVDEEIRPHLDDLEHNDVPPYEILRKMYDVFGLKEIAKENFQRQLDRKISGNDVSSTRATTDPAPQLISTIELCRVSPGMLTSLGVSTGLAAGTINKLGTPEQMQRWALDLMTLDKIGAWAITEPDSGSDALGGMRTTATRDGDDYILNGQKTWITNGPYADTIVLYAKLDDGSGAEIRNRKVLTFVLDRGMKGLEQAKRMRKMGQHASPTGEIFLSDVRVARDRLLGESEDPVGGGRQSARDNFVSERAGVAAMSLGIIEECLKLSIDYARHRTLWQTPIGDFQLIQLKLAQMEVARINVRNMVFSHIERSDRRSPKRPR